MLLRDKQGFTLIEMIISLALIAVMGVAFYGVFSYCSSYSTTGDILTDLQRTAYAAMEDMSVRIKEGQTIDIPSIIYSDVASASIDVTDSDGDITSYFYNDDDLLRNNNDGSADITLVDGDTYITGVEFDDNNPVVTVRLRVILNDTTVGETGHANIVLVQGDEGGCNWACGLACHRAECGEDCIDLHTDVVTRNRLLNPSP